MGKCKSDPNKPPPANELTLNAVKSEKILAKVLDKT